MSDINELGLLRMGVSEVFKPSTNKVIGWVHAEPDQGGTRLSTEGAQYQRWLLFTETQNDFAVRPAPADLSNLSLDRFREEVKKRWQPQSRFIWARARIFAHGGTYGGVTWTSLPPADRLPLAQDPQVRGMDFQLDVTGGKVMEIMQEVSRGQAVVFGRKDGAGTIEYWRTDASFQPAGRTAQVRIAQGSGTAESLDQFVALSAPAWAPGSVLSIVGCVMYVGDQPYAWL